MVLVLPVVSIYYYLLKMKLLFHVYCYFCHNQLQPSLKIIGRLKVCSFVITIIIIITFHFCEVHN
jgi:hypothetical protein